jgi:hypothetical protein
MKKCLLIFSDHGFFTYTKVALNTFIAHNPDWDIKFVGLNLNSFEEQILKFSNIDLIKEEPVTGKWIQARARVKQLVSVMDSGQYDLVACLDADTLCFSNCDRHIKEFMDSSNLYALGHGENLGFTLFKSDPLTLRILKDARNAFIDRASDFVLADESAVNLAFYFNKKEPLVLDHDFHYFVTWHRLECYNFTKRGSFYNGKPIVVTHFVSQVLLDYLYNTYDKRFQQILEVWHEYFKFINLQPNYICTDAVLQYYNS